MTLSSDTTQGHFVVICDQLEGINYQLDLELRE